MVKSTLRKVIHKRYRISFSKSGEDLQIFKLLKKIKGTYLDIGCFEPITFSNTYFFYLRGWNGLVVDPNPDLVKLFARERPSDTFINKGISSQSGELKYYRLPHSLSSMNTFDIKFLEEKNLVNFIEDEITIPLTTMSTLVSEYGLSGVDFLDVDVEGMDLEVLGSNNWDKFRPTVTMVETEKEIEEDLQGDLYRFMIDRDYTLMSKVVQSPSGAGNLIFMKNEAKRSLI